MTEIKTNPNLNPNPNVVLCKRVRADARGPMSSESDIENILNIELLDIQNKGGKIISVKEVTKETAMVYFLVLYEMQLSVQDATRGMKK